MNRIIRSFTVCAVAALALGTLGASVAQAVPGKITAAEYPAFITGEQEAGGLTISFSKGIREVLCTTTKISATIKEASAATAFAPTFAGCTTSPGGGAAEVIPHGCTFEYSFPNAKAIEMLTKLTNCPGTAPLEIIAKSTTGSKICSYSVSNQGPLGGSVWANVAAAIKDVTFKIDSEMEAMVTQGTLAACGAATGKPVFLDWFESVTVKGFKDVGGAEGGQIPIEID
jgi:hypothetical protein